MTLDLMDTVTVTQRRFVFQVPSRVVTLTDNITDSTLSPVPRQMLWIRDRGAEPVGR